MAECCRDREQVADPVASGRRACAPHLHHRGATARLRACVCALLLGWAASIAVSSAAHPLSLQECFEGGDFIAHAAEARDKGMTKAAFLDRLVVDVYAIQAFPPQLRWFVVDPEDAEFLTSQASDVFDRPRSAEAHRAEFLSLCFDR